MSIADRLAELGIVLPEVAAPVGSYVSAVRAGELVFVSGQLPMREGKLTAVGKVGGGLDVAAGQQAARLAAINALAAVEAEIGSLDKVVRVVRLEAYVNSAAGFTDQAKVANGASDLLGEVFGGAGKHSRIALGLAELPLDAAVELALVVQVG